MTISARRTLRAAVPVSLTIVLAGLLVPIGLHLSRGRPTIDDGPVAVARQEAQNFFSLDYRTGPADTQRVLDLATNPFKADYASKRSQVQTGLTLKKLHLTATITDNATALEYEHGANAWVLVAVDSTTEQAGGPSQSNHYRVRVELTRIDSSWRVAQFNQVG